MKMRQNLACSLQEVRLRRSIQILLPKISFQVVSRQQQAIYKHSESSVCNHLAQRNWDELGTATPLCDRFSSYPLLASDILIGIGHLHRTMAHWRRTFLST